jgi:hypothetical protein
MLPNPENEISFLQFFNRLPAILGEYWVLCCKKQSPVSVVTVSYLPKQSLALS